MKTNQIKKFLIVAVVFLLAAVVVHGSDIIAKAGDLNVTGDLDVTSDLTVDTSVFHVDSTSNRVGIGTTSPVYELDVEGSTILGSGDGTHRTYIGRYSAGYPWSIIHAGGSVSADVTSGFEFRADDDTTIMTLEKSGGQVGIGTTAPAAKLHISETTTDVSAFTSSHSNGGTWSLSGHFQNTAASGNVAAGILRISSSQTANANLVMLNIVDAGAERFKVFGDGDVYVAKDVTIGSAGNHNLFLQSGSDYGQFYWDATNRDLHIIAQDSSDTNGRIIFKPDGSQALLLERDNDAIFYGNVGIGTSNPSHELNVVGDSNITGTATFDGMVQFNKGIRRYRATKSADFTIGNTDVDIYLVTTGAGGVTATLPAVGSNVGREITFVKVDSGAGALTIDGAGAETIDGQATNTEVDAQYDSITVYSSGIYWYIIAKKIA